MKLVEENTNKDIFQDLKTKINEIEKSFDKYENNVFDSLIGQNTIDLHKSINDFNEVKKDFKEEYYCSKFCCCLKKKYRNDEKIKNNIKEIQKMENSIEDKLELIVKNEIEYQYFNSKIELICFIVASFFHFFAISEIYSVKFALFREIKKTIYCYFHEKYDINEQKTFNDYYKYSILRDISQTNISYITSYLTMFLVSPSNAWKVYLVSIIIIFLIMISIPFIEFKDRHQIENNENYGSNTFTKIILAFLGIYLFAGIICLMPIYLYKNLNKYNIGFNIILCSLITFSVIIKILLHSNYEFSLVTSSLFFLVSLIFLFFLLWKRNKNDDNKRQNHKENGKEKVKLIVEMPIIINKDGKKEDDDNDSSNGKTMTENNDSQIIPNDDNDNKEKIFKEDNYKSCFYLGYLIVKFKNICIFIKIRGICNYISKFFCDQNLMFLLLINFFSRAQKLRFKFDYKENLEKKTDDENPHLYIISNFLVSCYSAIILVVFLKFIDKNNNIEINIIKCILLDNIWTLISSILCLFNIKIKTYIIIISTAISSNINYLFYIFYSKDIKNFISLSAFFSLSTLLLRVCEIIGGPFQNYIFQIIFSIIAIILSCIYLKKFKESKILFNTKIFNYILFLILLIYFIISITFFTTKNNNENKRIEDEEFIKSIIYDYCYEAVDTTIYDDKYTFEKSGVYSVCAYGPHAKNGGKGGKICGQNYFQKDSQLKFEFGGREAGGEGGKGCGFWENGNGKNGAGYTSAELLEGNFNVVAGGGGGDSESGQKGGDAEKDGKGTFYGRGATEDSAGIGGDNNSTKEKGSKYRGGSGESKNKIGKFCGGGGGSGYKGGGAGNWGDKGNDGGGGGGSNYCKAEKCSQREINDKSVYSCVEIIEIIEKGKKN